MYCETASRHTLSPTTTGDCISRGIQTLQHLGDVYVLPTVALPAEGCVSSVRRLPPVFVPVFCVLQWKLYRARCEELRLSQHHAGTVSTHEESVTRQPRTIQG